MTRIPIEEEYGFQHWIWETPDSFESAVENFASAVNDEKFYFAGEPDRLNIGGKWTKVEYDEYIRAIWETGVHGHLHTSNDSYINRNRTEEV